MSVFVDTSALYALMDRDDAEHRAASERWTALLRGPTELMTSNYVVVETSALVQHRLGLSALRLLTSDLLGVVRIEWVQPEDHQRALGALLSVNRRKLSLVDCVSFEMMRRCNVKLAFEFDSHFRDAGFKPA